MRRALRCLLLVVTTHPARCKVALITGANGGIGAELVVQFARAGYDVVAACRSRSAHVHQLVSKASVANKVKVLLGLDVTSPEKVNAFVDGLKRQRTAVDVLVHAAGVATWQLSSATYPGMTEPMALESLDYGLVARAFEINAIGPLRLTESCLKQGLLGTGAKIAFVSSKLGSVASNTQLGANYAYRMSKSALNAAGRSLAVDLRPRDISVVLLHPGYVATPMTGDRGDVVAAVSAAGLFQRIASLNASASGSFIDYDGRQVPW